jgi:hypothetical protein
MNRNNFEHHRWLSVKTTACMMLLFAVLTIHPLSLWAQAGKSVIFPSRTISITNALNEIERQTGYHIAINWKNVDSDRNIMLSANRLSVESTLNEVLAGTNLEWEIIGNTIAIVNGEKPAHITGPVYSTMNRNRLPDGIVVVPDPYSKRQISATEITRIANGYWRSDNERVTDSIGLIVLNFRMNSTTLERDYMDNARALDVILSTFSDKQMLTDMDFITIIAASSPEGNTSTNDKLAAGRARAVKSYIMWKYPFMNRERIFTFSIGEDWTGLRKMVAEDWNVPYQREVLRVLDSGHSSNAMRSALKRIGGGTVYRYIADNLLPRLRGAAACMIYYKQKPEPTEEIVVVEKIVRDTVYIDRIVERQSAVESTVPVERVKKPLFALKTNLLMDLGTAINIEAEVPIGRRWSVAGEWLFPWWLIENDQIALQTGVATLEVRSYLGNREGRQPLTGWFLGAHGGWGYYDLEWRDKGYQGELWYTGLSGGYAHTINRSGTLRMEYSLGVGYMNTGYTKYAPQKDGNGDWHLMRRKEANRDYIGPTRAKVSLVWMLNRNSKKKGGAQ